MHINHGFSIGVGPAQDRTAQSSAPPTCANWMATWWYTGSSCRSRALMAASAPAPPSACTSTAGSQPQSAEGPVRELLLVSSQHVMQQQTNTAVQSVPLPPNQQTSRPAIQQYSGTAGSTAHPP